MKPSAEFLTASEAARRLGVSAKALRLYEQRGLLRPARTAAGWRAYGPEEMARASEIAALRALGLSLAQSERVLAGEAGDLGPALMAHQAALETRALQLSALIERVRALRADIDRGRAPSVAELAGLLDAGAGSSLAFDLPWPWGGERFELSDIRPLTYIVGPLGSGKTRLAKRIAETLPGAAFIGLDRLETGEAAMQARFEADPALAARVGAALAWLAEDGASPSAALTALVAALEAEGPSAFVVDMVEQGLDQASQEALAAHLRRTGSRMRPLFLMTRSSAFLDLPALGAKEAVVYCPANHSPPMLVEPRPGCAGYEAVVTCLASPEVRARSEGMIAWRPQAA